MTDSEIGMRKHSVCEWFFIQSPFVTTFSHIWLTQINKTEISQSQWQFNIDFHIGENRSPEIYPWIDSQMRKSLSDHSQEPRRDSGGNSAVRLKNNEDFSLCDDRRTEFHFSLVNLNIFACKLQFEIDSVISFIQIRKTRWSQIHIFRDPDRWYFLIKRRKSSDWRWFWYHWTCSESW
jgi:hypothetical protein